MWPFNENQEEPNGVLLTEDALQVEEKPQVEQKPKVVCPQFGERVGGLTRFGKTWMNLDEVSVIEFDPPDGCGCEVMFKNNSGEWHVSDEDALAMKTYLEGIESVGKQVDNH